MMSSICPAGHTSTAEDYCDVCGVPIGDAAGAPSTSPPPPPDAPAQAAVPSPDAGTSQPCPNCGTETAAQALFCENCGYDFTTGSMPRPALDSTEESAPASTNESATLDTTEEAAVLDTSEEAAAAPPVDTFTTVAEIWLDPDWYAAQQSPDPMPSPGLPEVVALRTGSSLIGRVSVSRNIHPVLDCGSDSGVSRRQSQLTTDGRRWWVEDLESANGTFVGPASGPLPEDPIAVGVKTELAGDDRIYVGAWTRIVVRPATDDELSSLT